MGEVVLSSDELEKTKNTTTNNNNRAEVSTTTTTTETKATTRLERFLPMMMMRVLLVEADDSTRQIIAALLRKCSYRVACVPDGLTAWELLKGRPHNVDLILTEVDLPSISGFALLTLIMEHEICKNIPVIMMSSQDSISTVYKCMMRGAADYLVKPIRRNELSNLWQHVWRRKASNASNGPHDESVAQRKAEETSENDAASNHSNGNTACIQRNDEEDIDKGSDAQSSCTKPHLEAESVHIDKIQELSQPTLGESLPRNDEARIIPGKQPLTSMNEGRGNFEDAGVEIMVGKDFTPEKFTRDSIKTNDVSLNQTRDPIDLNEFMSDNPNCNYQNSSTSKGTSKFGFAPTVDLTLRSNSGAFEIHITEKRPALGRSNSSAFSRYINRPLQSLNQTSTSNFDQEKECGTKPENHVSIIGSFHGCNSDTPKSVLTLATGQSNHSEVTNYCPQQRVFPRPIPVKGTRISKPSADYGSSSVPSVFCSQSGSSSMVGANSVAQQESSFFVNTLYQTNPEMRKPEQPYGPLCSNICVTRVDQEMRNQERKLDSFQDQSHVSPRMDRDSSTSFCNGNASSHFTSLGYGSNVTIDQVSIAPEHKNEESYVTTNNGNSHRSIQREAALTKFRMKRKDRCFEKKVRYESRKKLAEQRPRVKGQFVRQAQLDHHSPSLTDGIS